jgi:hypothetical protein
MSDMTASAKFLMTIGFIATALINTPSMADQVQPPKKDNCVILAHFNATKTVRALLTFSMPIFGKHPERWTVEDIDNLKNNVAACDNKPVEYAVTSRVFSSAWRFALGEESVNRFLDLSNKSTQVADLVKDRWPGDMKLPYCGDLLKWRRDPIWLINNSQEIFGKSFLKVNDDEKPVINLYIESCMPVMEGILKSRKLGSRNAARMAADILAGLDRDISAQRWNNIELVPALQMEHENQSVPLAYASEQTRDVVLKINTSEQKKIPLDIDSLSTISSWVSDMGRRGKEGPDQLYVAAIKKIVSRQLFQQEKRFDGP